MNARRAAALAVALAFVATGSANAAVKKSCKIVTDDPGDTFAARAQDGTAAAAAGPKEDGFDILSADIATSTKFVTAVIRVKKLSSAIQTSPLGAGFSFDFLLPTSSLQASMRAVYVTGQAPYYEVTSKDPKVPNSPSTFLALAKGFADTKKNEVHITAPLSAFASLGTIKKNTLIQPAGDAATSGRAVPTSPGTAGRPVATRYVFADVATVSKPYRAGNLSCVTPGK
jgi:hypothetical protein